MHICLEPCHLDAHVVEVVSLGFIWTIPVYFDERRYKIRFNFRYKVSYLV